MRIIILFRQKLINVLRLLMNSPLQSCLCDFSFSVSTRKVEGENG